MKTFSEIQVLKGTRQGWIVLGGAVLVIVSGLAIPLIQNASNPNQAMTAGEMYLMMGMVGAIAAFLFTMFLTSRLIVGMGPSGISYRYPPFVSEKRIAWDEIQYAWVRKYNPMLEYGGWGYRGLRRRRAFNMSGNIGIQIITKTGRQMLLGITRQSQASAVLVSYGFGFAAPVGWEGPVRSRFLRLLGMGR